MRGDEGIAPYKSTHGYAFFAAMLQGYVNDSVLVNLLKTLDILSAIMIRYI